MMEIRRFETQLEDQTIAYNHYYSDSDEICFMLSGAGYAYDHPYFYFSRMMLLKRGVNVIEIQYVSDDLFSMPDEQGDAEMSRRIEAVIGTCYGRGRIRRFTSLPNRLGRCRWFQ